jgi:nanoRNase/pAp phosphatase (c-di-AMP/oligoRNAs hydrolase)
MLNDSLESSVVAGSTVISHIPKVSSPDMLAEVAELMLRLRGMRTAVCYGATESTIHLSARTVDARGNVARRMRTAVEDLGGGGGHKTMAGGQVSFEEGELDERLAEVFQRILEAFAGDEPPRRLLDG